MLVVETAGELAVELVVTKGYKMAEWWVERLDYDLVANLEHYSVVLTAGVMAVLMADKSVV